MQTQLSAEFQDTPLGTAAEAILRSCVHCGFCNATCPTYQVLGDELDGPRGRIYLIKQMLEGGEVGRSTQLHLDRCLTCLNCETTCPSGVEYGKLVAIGRILVDERVTRPAWQRAVRWVLREGMTSRLFAPALRVAQRVRGSLPTLIRDKVPARRPAAASRPPTAHDRKVLLLAGCVQPAMFPNINAATQRVLDACGIETVVAAKAGCCGALREHLSDPEGSLANARCNIDAWWPSIETGAIEAVVTNASACGLAVKQYGDALAHDAAYAAKARRISALARDLSELLPELAPTLASKLRPRSVPCVMHTPCTLQHGQQLGGLIETQLRALGFTVTGAPEESHLCCGSAGAYSVLQPLMSTQLRDRKLRNLLALEPHCIVSANVGCIQHLQSGTATPVRHWIEIVAAALL